MARKWSLLGTLKKVCRMADVLKWKEGKSSCFRASRNRLTVLSVAPMEIFASETVAFCYGFQNIMVYI